MAWDDTKREKAKEMYLEAGPTAETSTEIVADVAEALGESVNGVRNVLIKAGVYIAKGGSTAGTSEPKAAKKTGGTKVSKDEAHAQLTARIEALGKEVDSDIISKLTGKAAIYFSEILSPL